MNMAMEKTIIIDLILIMLLAFVALARSSSSGETIGGEEQVHRHHHHQKHHVVGDDRGWDASNDIPSWSSRRFFSVGDVIWFAYSAVEESVVELESLKELVGCELKNPIKRYTQGLDKVALDAEGSRYFASGNMESCKKGLKLHVNVHPPNPTKVDRPTTHHRPHSSQDVRYVVPADGPTLPSAASKNFCRGLSVALLGGFLLCYFVFH